MISMFLTNGMYLSFFNVLPRVSYGYIWCGFIPSMVWRFFQLFRCRNLALNRDVFPTLEADMGVVGIGAIHSSPYICMPIHPYAPQYSPVHLYVPPIPYIPHISWGFWVICTPIYVVVFWTASVHLSGISVCHYIHCHLVHDIHTSCSPSLWVTSLLDWMPMDV